MIPKLGKILILCVCVGIQVQLKADCPEVKNGVIYTNHNQILSFQDLASFAAPMLWFSPDEAQLYDSRGQIQLPQKFP